MEIRVSKESWLLLILFLGSWGTLQAQYKWKNPQEQVCPVIVVEPGKVNCRVLMPVFRLKPKAKCVPRFGTCLNRVRVCLLLFIPILRKLK